MTYAGSTQDERTKAGNTTFTSGFGGVTIASEPALLGSSNTYYTRDDRGNLVSERLPSGTYYYLFDGLGSVVALTDVNGAVANRYAYDPYGNAIASGTSGSVVNPWRFAGGYLDTATGLYKFGARFYDPALGRWTQRDPSGIDSNPYAYAGDNPVNFVDPTGYYCVFGTHDGPGSGCRGGSLNNRSPEGGPTGSEVIRDCLIFGAAGAFYGGPSGAVVGCGGSNLYHAINALEARGGWPFNKDDRDD